MTFDYVRFVRLLPIFVVIVCELCCGLALAGPDPTNLTWVDGLEDQTGTIHVFALDRDGNAWHTTGRDSTLVQKIDTLDAPLRALRVFTSSDSRILLVAINSHNTLVSAEWRPSGPINWRRQLLQGIRELDATANDGRAAVVATDIRGRMFVLDDSALRAGSTARNTLMLAGGPYHGARVAVSPAGALAVAALDSNNRVIAFAPVLGRPTSSRPGVTGPVARGPLAVAFDVRPGSLVLWGALGGTLEYSVLASNLAWGPVQHLASPISEPRDLRLISLGDGSLALTVQGPDKLAVRPLTAATTPGSEWQSFPASASDLAKITYLGSGRLHQFGADIFRAVDLSTIEITSMSPPVLWEQDVLSAKFRITNRRTSTLDGLVRGQFAGKLFSNKLGATLLPLAAGASGDGTLTLANLPAGAQQLWVQYLDVAMNLHYPDPHTGQPVSKQVYQLGFEGWVDLEVRAYRDRYTSDSPDVVPGAYVCKSSDPAGMQMSIGNKGICDASGSTPGANCPAPMDPPVITSYNRIVGCDGLLVAPSTTSEVQSALQFAHNLNKSVRIVGNRHSANGLICGDGLILSMENMRGEVCNPSVQGGTCGPIAECTNSTGSSSDPDRMPCLETRDGVRVVQTRPGQSLFALAERLYASHLSLGYAIPGFREPTVGGAIATGTHGSSISHPVVISSRVRNVTIVKADGTVEDHSAANTSELAMRALRASLGYLGVVTKVGLSVEPAFDLTTSLKWYDNAADEFAKAGSPFNLLTGCDFGQMIWFPGAGNQMVRMCGQRVPENSGTAENRALLAVLPDVSFLKQVPYLSGIDLSGTQMAPFLTNAACGCAASVDGHCLVDTCTLEKARAGMLRHLYPPLSETDCGPNAASAFVARMVGSDTLAGSGCDPTKTGHGHRMMSSEVDKTTFPILQQRDWEIFIPHARVQDALKFAASYLNSQNICLPLIGIFLRFAPAQSETLIAHTTAQGPFAANEAGMFFEMPVVLPKQMTCSDQRRYEEKYNVLANQLVTQFGGRAHWGKNRASLFQEQRRDGTYGDNLKDFRDIVRQFDPSGMFANRYGYDLGLRWPDRPALPDTDSAAYACIPD